MNPAERLELDALRQEHARARRLMDELDQRLALLARRLESEPAPEPILPPPLPQAPAMQDLRLKPAPIPVAPPPKPKPQEIPAAPVAPPPPIPVAPAESIELRLGTYWLARIGIVILLTGLVFLGNYAYHRVIPMLGPWGKLTLLALAAGALAGTGAWLERSRESMRGYARVLIAGGAATFYYAAFAAHFVERLRVIQSPLVGGVLLLAIGGGIAWFAGRRKSEPTALLAVLLSYYTSAINPIGGFTLFSSLLLTAAAVWFLVRQRWVTLSIASLAATYGSYAFWRWHHLAGAESGAFGMSLAYLCGYWLLFTAAVFLAAREALPPPKRAAFLTANNGAFFAFAAQQFAAERPHDFWMFALGFGGVLLALAALAARRNADEKPMDGAYLAQGLALVTVGLAAKLTGPQLSTTLAVESAVLLTFSRLRHGVLYQIAAGLAALGAFVLAMGEIHAHPALTLSLGGTVAALLLFNAWWFKHLHGLLAAMRFDGRAFGFTALGLLLAGSVMERRIVAEWEPAAFALAALLCAVSIRAVRMPEIALPGQAFLVVGVALFIQRSYEAAPEPWWNPLPLVLAAIALAHWWQRQPEFELSVEAQAALEIAAAAAAAVTGALWMRTFHTGNAWLVWTSAAAVGSLLYGLGTRAWSVALAGQLFTALAAYSFATGLLFSHPSSRAALAPIAALAFIAVVLSRLAAARMPSLPGGVTFTEIASYYRIAAAAMLAAWGFEYVDHVWLTAFFAGLGAVQILGGSALRDRERVITGAVFSAIGFWVFWTMGGRHIEWQHLPAILAVPASMRLGRRFADLLPAPARNALTIAALACVWVWLTRWTYQTHSASQLTMVWALLALVVFAAGLTLRERVYRIGGFAILALAVGRVFLVDVWKLETLFRILSFLVLGAVLLLLGFIYNRFADTIRRWL